MENYSIHKKRLRQLQANNVKKELEWKELIDFLTKPIISHLFPYVKPKNLEQLEMDLKMAKWDKYFTPVQYRALNLLLKIVGVLAFLFLFRGSLVLALLWGLALFVGMDILFKNSIKNRKEKLLKDFPELIYITEGYLAANFPFAKAIQESIKYVGEEWKPILQKFVVDCEMTSVEEALDNLKKEVDLFEMKEFVSIVRLVLEQGGDAKDAFKAQAEKIEELHEDIVENEIGKRQTMGMLIQGPLLISVFIVVGLPVITSMINFNTM